MKVEFATIEELYESGATFLKETDFGFIGEIIEEKTVVKPTVFVRTNTKSKKIHRVYTKIMNDKLYISKNGETTFQINDAKEMSKEEAEKKAFFMSRNGVHEWNVE